MKTHEFTLTIGGICEATEEFANAIFEAGCDDATCGSSRGRVFVDFDRDAETFLAAVLSAIADVQRAGFQVIRIDETNPVSQAEIARRLEVSRQMVNQYVSGKRGSGDFPPPTGTNKAGAELWEWNEVAEWLRKNNAIDDDTLERSSIVNVINSFLAIQRQEGARPEMVKIIRDSMAAT